MRVLAFDFADPSRDLAEAATDTSGAARYAAVTLRRFILEGCYFVTVDRTVAMEERIVRPGTRNNT
eukprot:538422-Rhodomonas_salina.1